MYFFAADAHLSAFRPARAAAFFSFLRAAAGRENSIYLLGDIFDLWAGDDDKSDLANETRVVFSEIAKVGTKIYVQRGNRDFLIGQKFCRDTGCVLLPDLFAMECGGRRFLLAHGDVFCEDAAYLRYRKIVQSAAFATIAKMLPLSLRKNIAAKSGGESRNRSRRQKTALSRTAINSALQRHNCQTLIHGHLHRAEKEEWTDNGKNFRRFGLPDWETQNGGWLKMDGGGEVELKFG